MSNQIPNTSFPVETTNQEPETTTFTEMFRFAKKRDIIYISIGTFCSIVVGGVFPFFSYLWGNMTDAFTNLDEMVKLALNIFVQYSSFGVGAIFAGWGMQYFWTVAGERQANQCRKAYIEALMKQEVGWFEIQNTAEIISKFVTDTEALQLAIGEKVSLMIYLISMFFSGFIVAMTQGWQLTLVITAFLPALVYSWEIMERFDHRKVAFEDTIFQKANSMAAETINSIKIVKQFNGEIHQQKRFQEQINEVKQRSFQFNIKVTLAESLSLFCYLFAFALAFWYGSQCIQGTSNCPQRQHNPYTGGTIVTIFFCLTIPAMNLHQLAPSLKVISEGRIAAARIFKIIDRVPQVRSPQQPIKIENLKGVFRFQEVSFAYPKDKSRPVLTGINMTIDCRRAGIMGESGSGKSTLFQLMMRLYDPNDGVVTLDGVDLRQLDLRWLRSQIAYVGQEPLLFSASIRENLYVGRSKASDQQLTKALSEAEMLQFVAGLSEGVDTFVGIGGSQLSGGQKQRIAIARAFIKDPHILLFDEATSALDRRNERFTQSTLNRVAAGKISITIAHRPQTILGCDQIFFIDQGKLTKQGSLQQFPIVVESMRSIESEKFLSRSEIVDNETAHVFTEQKANILSSQALKNHKKKEGKEIIASATNLVNNEPAAEVVKPVDNLYTRLFGHTKDDKGVTFLIILGVMGSLMHGLVMPSMGIHVGRVLAFDLLYPTNPDHYRDLIKWECLYMLLTCFAGALVKGLQFITFLHLGTSVVNNIRKEAYGKVLRLPLTWFQCEQNHAEQVPAKIGTQIYKMKHIITSYVPHLSVAMGSIVSGLLLAFYFEWRTALVAIGLIPLIGVSAIFQYSFITGYMNQSKKLYEESTKIIAESLTNFKTVLSFCYQEEIIAKYSKILDDIQDRQFLKKLISGLIFGISFFTLFFVYGLTFYLAALFIRDNRLEITNAFCAVLLVLFTGIVAGNNAKNIPDLSMLKVTAQKLFSIIDLEDEDQIQRKKGSKLINREIKGNIAFKDVKFKYENREEIALKGVSFQIKQGEKVGLVGESGCGKSTILKLLLGFYSCQQGYILIDGDSIEDYDIHCLRQHFGTVSQQPDLFDQTVEYNIIYNAEGIKPEQIEEAAQKAQLYSGEDKEQQSERAAFFKRKVGPRGTHLSGGQKQRVAIARVILKNPNVLLLDEATSALDKQNEEKVQNCLNSMMEGRTTLSVTHKLDTLTNASHILVFKKGQLIQEGNYEKLIEKKNQFYRILIGLEE